MLLRMRAIRSACLLPLLAGCKGCEPEETFTPTLEVLDATPVGVHVGDGVGNGTAELVYFAINAEGAAVPATDPIDFGGLDGSVDGFGWGTLSASVDSHGLAAVSATMGEHSATGYAYGLPELGDVGDRARVPVDGADWLAGAGQGVVWGDGISVWWADVASDRPPVRVLRFDGDILGATADNLDGDGIGDLVVWTADRVTLLRGREGGGLVWAAGAWLSSGSIGGVGIGDLDDDADLDVLVAVNDGESSRVAVLDQVAAWTFEEVQGMPTGFDAHGVAAGIFDGTGEPQLALLTEDATLRRFTRYEEDWIAAASTDIDVGIAEGALMPRARDFTADGAEDILIAGPRVEGFATSQILSFADGSTIYPTFGSNNLPLQVAVDATDVSGDGAADLFVATDSALTVAEWYASTGTFYTRNHDLGQSFSGVAIFDADADAVPDAALLGEVVRLVGAVLGDDGAWTPSPDQGAAFAFQMAGVPRVRDLSGDGVMDVVGFRDAGTGPILQVLRGRPPEGDTSETLLAGTNAAYGSGAVARDFAACDGEVWSLVEADGATTLYRYSVDESGNLASAGSVDAALGTQIACGDFPDGSVVQLLDASGGTRGWDAAFSEVDVVDLGTAWADVAAVEIGGVDTLVGCDCQLSVGEVDGAGDGDRLEVGAAGSVLVVGDTSHALPGATSGALTDADGDGLDDVVLQQGDDLVVWRLAGGRLAPAAGRVLARELTAVGGFGDLNADSVPDLFAVGTDGALVYAESQ